MTSDEFYAWKSDPTTKAIFEAIEQLVDEGKEVLSVSAGVNSINDARAVGKIEGLRTVLGISFDEVQND